jgi:hypothetical protein
MQEDDRVSPVEVVLDCTKRWFQDALKEAHASDTAMQVLVSLMCAAEATSLRRQQEEHKVSPTISFIPDFRVI